MSETEIYKRHHALALQLEYELNNDDEYQQFDEPARINKPP